MPVGALANGRSKRAVPLPTSQTVELCLKAVLGSCTATLAGARLATLGQAQCGSLSHRHAIAIYMHFLGPL